ncbi:MAG: hypothetical protein IPL61_05360 [Myxococcales bacterium]|nr:hypothetical protein [Myxococcales bacterium]
MSARPLIALTAIVAAALAPACAGDRGPAAAIDAAPAAEAAPPAVIAPPPIAVAPPPIASAPPAPAPPPGHDFLPDARALQALALCQGDTAAALPPGVRARHCARVAAIQERYRARWLTPARAFLATIVPADVPTTVVYPFAGGDLATALTVFPAATELTTLSLEPAGDPRTIATLTPAQRARALAVIADELRFLYVANFSNTRNLIDAMRGGELPTQLAFSLSALALHDCELVWVRYFRLAPDGAIAYLTDADVAAAPPATAGARDRRNRAFGDVELGFRRAGDPTVRVYRHLQANLDDAHLGADGRVLAHLAAKGHVAAMTKAAAYLLGWDTFARVRAWLIADAVWMVSDASGLPPQRAAAAGLGQEVWGQFVGAHMHAPRASDRAWRALFAASPTRALPIPFGYRDRRGHAHLIVTRRP